MLIYRCFRVLRTVPLLILAGCFIVTSSVQADDVFTVSDVKVDVTAENAVAAREKAFSEAQVQAFMALAQKLLGDTDFTQYRAPDVAVISAMIKDFEITNERLSAVQYIGTYTFRFEGDAVRGHFNKGGMRYNDVESKPVLVLPFFQMAGRTVLWQEENPWLAAWANDRAPAGMLVPIAVPLGDIRDVADIGDNEALAYSPAGLNSMLARYGAGEAVVLVAVPEMGVSALPEAVSIMMYRTDTYMPQLVRTLRVSADPGANAASLYEKAEKEIRSAIQSDWKTQMAVNPVTENNAISVHVRFQTMQQWVETRQTMMRVQGILDMKVRSVTPREAQVDLRFAGDENRLRQMMAQADLILSQPQMGGDAAYGDAPAFVYTVTLRKYASY